MHFSLQHLVVRDIFVQMRHLILHIRRHVQHGFFHVVSFGMVGKHIAYMWVGLKGDTNSGKKYTILLEQGHTSTPRFPKFLKCQV